jgi:hypothetical protein
MTANSGSSADRDAIIQRSFAYATGVDRRDWALYADCFTDPCEFDFSSWNQRPPTMIGPAVWAVNVAGTNGNFDATQHMMSNHVITFTGDDEAIGVNELIAQHWFSAESMATFERPDEVSWCILGGHYTNTYVRCSDGAWRITRCRLDVRYTTGNPGVFSLARGRRASVKAASSSE